MVQHLSGLGILSDLTLFKFLFFSFGSNRLSEVMSNYKSHNYSTCSLPRQFLSAMPWLKLETSVLDVAIGTFQEMKETECFGVNIGPEQDYSPLLLDPSRFNYTLRHAHNTCVSTPFAAPRSTRQTYIRYLRITELMSWQLLCWNRELTHQSLPCRT